MAAASSRSLNHAGVAGGTLYWIEGRPEEGGRSVLMARRTSGEVVDVLDRDEDARSRVHEYGGVPWTEVGGLLVYPNFSDQRLRVRRPGGGVPSVLTPAGCRYADGDAAPDGRFMVCVREDHRQPGEARNAVVLLRPGREVDEADEGTVLFGQSDFVAAPRLRADAKQLAFIAWDHPAMPWYQTQLMVGELAGDTLVGVKVVAGGTDESVIEPQWGPDGSLYFLSDRSGWWNLYRWRDGAVEALTALEAEIGGPLWELGARSYALTGDGRALLRVNRANVDQLALLDLHSRTLRTLELPHVAFKCLGMLDVRTAFAIAYSADMPEALILVDMDDGSHQVLRQAGSAALPPAWVSRAEAIEFPTAPGPGGEKRSAHAWFHAPHAPDWRPPEGEAPPLMVMMHGGPTSRVTPAFLVAVQFWTTRGFAVAHVNYGGSTGYGRAYRERLDGQWGVVDLQDAVACVDALVAAGRVDGGRVVMRGGSAGGFSVLSALAFSDRFAAGINYYGVSDLQALASDTHKFESRYLDRLVGPLPECTDVYRARSPAHHMHDCRGALLTFQGSDDRAVPPQQSRDVVAAARAAGCVVEYVEFEGEGHGFRKEANIVRAMQCELVFLGRVLGFGPSPGP
jgi:dipeptidyl aminopeptidase/acylaminoacyl peptidase